MSLEWTVENPGGVLTSERSTESEGNYFKTIPSPIRPDAEFRIGPTRTVLRWRDIARAIPPGWDWSSSSDTFVFPKGDHDAY